MTLECVCVNLFPSFCSTPLRWYFFLLTLYILFYSSVSHFFCVSQEVLVWLTALQKEMGGEVSDEQMRDYIWNTLKSGRVKNHDHFWSSL